jgi:hypothetical protein
VVDLDVGVVVGRLCKISHAVADSSACEKPSKRNSRSSASSTLLLSGTVTYPEYAPWGLRRPQRAAVRLRRAGYALVRVFGRVILATPAEGVGMLVCPSSHRTRTRGGSSRSTSSITPARLGCEALSDSTTILPQPARSFASRTLSWFGLAVLPGEVSATILPLSLMLSSRSSARPAGTANGETPPVRRFTLAACSLL